MEIKELIEKYKLSQGDFWQLPQNKNLWIISHEACEKIASIENIELDNIQVLNSEKDFARFLITMKKNDKKIMSVGEATLKENCQSKYIGCMAEKRGIDRCILKLINAYEYGVKSDSESDDFQKVDNKPVSIKTDIQSEKNDVYTYIMKNFRLNTDQTIWLQSELAKCQSSFEISELKNKVETSTKIERLEQ